MAQSWGARHNSPSGPRPPWKRGVQRWPPPRWAPGFRPHSGSVETLGSESEVMGDSAEGHRFQNQPSTWGVCSNRRGFLVKMGTPPRLEAGNGPQPPTPHQHPSRRMEHYDKSRSHSAKCPNIYYQAGTKAGIHLYLSIQGVRGAQDSAGPRTPGPCLRPLLRKPQAAEQPGIFLASHESESPHTSPMENGA